MPESWNDLIFSLPGAHFLQTSHWAEIKKEAGWNPFFLCWVRNAERWEMVVWNEKLTQVDAAALVLERSFISKKYIPSIRIQYTPKGPLLDWENKYLVTQVLQDLVEFCRKRKSVFIKIDPDLIIESDPKKDSLRTDLLNSDYANLLRENGWLFSNEQIQFRNTFRLNLTGDSGDLLSRMKQKTRYNIRLAGRRGVKVRKGTIDDLDILYQMYMETSIRDGFSIREPDYYYMVWKKFIDANMARILIAEFNHEAIAAVLLIQFAKKTWFVYGMSTNHHREKMPNYLLQWEAINSAKENHCQWYDFWGAPNELEEKDPLWGVLQFKEGFAGEFTRTIGAWDWPVNKLMYAGFIYLYPIIIKSLKFLNRNKIRVIEQ